MMLDREDRLVLQPQAAIRSVEQRHMGLLDIVGKRLLVDGEAVVHRDDLDLARGIVAHRMVGAMMALMHLDGFGAEGEAEHLVAEADAEDRDARIDELPDRGNGVVAGRRRVAGAV